jgi:hypothetical protein
MKIKPKTEEKIEVQKTNIPAMDSLCKSLVNEFKNNPRFKGFNDIDYEYINHHPAKKR